eukprot:4902834-Karenia_brevis.AAC.1
MHSDELRFISRPYGNSRRAVRGVILSGISFNGPQGIPMSLIRWPYGNSRRAMGGAILIGIPFSEPQCILVSLIC